MPTSRALRRILPSSAFLFVALAACARLHSDASRAVVMQQGAPLAMHGRVTDHVIVISIDGLRADAIHKYHAPTIERLMREGRYSLTAQTINTSLTLPSHTSMLTGVPETVHGVTWNSDKTKEKGYVA
ncbi:MAG TPA: alkaline phosphatase family protein, partial [Gemmatimonadaceae bacterium]